MRSILFLCNGTKRCKAMGAAIEAMDDHFVVTANSAHDAIMVIQSGCVDTVFIDLVDPLPLLSALVSISRERFPSIYLIFIRSTDFSLEQRTLLSKGHGSFSSPKSHVELEGLLHRFNRDYPVRVVEYEEESELEITATERVEIFLSAFSVEQTSQKDLVEAIRYDSDLTQLLMNRINSPFYGIPSRISEVDQAVRLLGVNGVISLFEESLGEEQKVA